MYDRTEKLKHFGEDNIYFVFVKTKKRKHV